MLPVLQSAEEPKQILVDAKDAPINQIWADGSEFRLVTRQDHQTIYCSSHTGCSLGCNFCWLTATGQTQMRTLSRDVVVERAARLVKLANQNQRVNFAFMARGDAMASAAVDADMMSELQWLWPRKKYAKVAISTIFPGTSYKGILERFGSSQPSLFWSLYSLDAGFRECWMPNAAEPKAVAAELHKWQQATAQDITIHHPLIAGQNDNKKEAWAMANMLANHRLSYRVNLVRYNAPEVGDFTQYVEASEETYEEHLAFWMQETRGKAKLQPRVGTEVYASCGCFTNG